MIEVKHLKTILKLQQAGSVVAAAEHLFTSQSALSHQLKELESRVGGPVFKRKTSPIEFTAKGEVLLSLAESVLPQIQQAETKLKPSLFKPQKLAIGIECHACFDWLLPAIAEFQQQQPQIETDLIGDSLFAVPSALREHSIIFTDEPHAEEGMELQVIGDFEVVLAMASNDILTQKAFIQPQDLNGATLITYPVEHQRLDVFKRFLQPANCQPAQWRKVENSHVILQMVAAGLGVSALPDWLVNKHVKQGQMVVKPLSELGLKRTLYASYHHGIQAIAELFLPIAKDHYSELSR
ncbi:LysR substrate-binding domain-containing protein [Alteromonadaceae bacterium BrNp21-10]|nr:LysR substrate-binding domain-containing protein [Alteromonadaceae bacterium BrNp21-10]